MCDLCHYYLLFILKGSAPFSRHLRRGLSKSSLQLAREQYICGRQFLLLLHACRLSELWLVMLSQLRSLALWCGADALYSTRWLPATPGANHSHCKPSPSSYDWYEYTCTSTCNGHGCRTHIVNFNASNPGVPSFEEDYVLAALDLGNGKLGELGLSYFDKPGGGYAVGTRRTLSDSDSDVETSEACHDAFTTLSRIRDDRRLALPFEMANICPLPSIPQIRQNLQAPSQRILRI